MKRYLLFDAGCKFSESAESINKEAGGKLTIRSLRDPEMKALLDRERPGWTWEPMLVEERGEKVSVYTGGAISRRLLFVLGPRRAWHLFMSVKKSKISSRTNMNLNIERRKFLSYTGLLFGSFVLRRNIANPFNFAEDQASLNSHEIKLSGALGSVHWKLLQGEDEIQMAARAEDSQEVENLAKILTSKGYTSTGELSNVTEIKGTDFTIRGLWLPYKNVSKKGDRW